MIPPNPKSFAKAAIRVAKAAMNGRPILVPDAEADRRLSICETPCQFLSEDGTQCVRCTCFIDAKTLLATEECPIGLWGQWKLTDDRKAGT